MNEIEKMRAFVESTKIPDLEKYYMTDAQMSELCQALLDGEFPRGILYEAYSYGLAIGYRAAKKEAEA